MLYVRKSWVVTGVILKVLENFHHRAAQGIAGMTSRHAEDREWEYPPVDYALVDAGICTIMEYIQRQQAPIMVQVAIRKIYELRTGAE